MIKLNTEQMLYLFYADAYSEEATVTKGNVKSYLPTQYKGECEKIYEFLRRLELIQQITKGRFSVTERGKEALLQNLSCTDYQFDSSKGPKVLNTLLKFIKQATQSPFLEDMTFDEFRDKFKTMYFEERKAKSLTGVIIVRKREISKQFINKYSISQELFEKHFKGLTSTREIIIRERRDDELIEWVE
jgi:hypothetical protein